jgi:membrane associated rhomboid family serine protease
MYGNSIWDDLKWQYRYGSPLIRIIILNAAVFVFINLLLLFDFFTGKNIGTLVSSYLSFWSDSTFFFRPWSILTFQFMHAGFLHLLFNMLALYWFGQIVQDFIGKNKIWPLYLMGGFAGAVLFSIGYHVVNLTNPGHVSAEVIGASAGVMAMVLAAATLSPDYEIRLVIFGPVKIKWIAFVYVVLDFLMIRDSNAGGHIAHLGGALYGWIYVRQLRNGHDLARPYYAVVDFFTGLFRKKDKLKVEYRRPEKEYANMGNKKQSQKQSQQNTQQRSKQERLDEILDKISKSGYESLNKEEKDFLFQISKED